jgi:hypothetical protein
VTIHARRTSATFTPSSYRDMFFDDVKTIYDLDQPETHRIRVDQSYSDTRIGGKPKVELASQLHLRELKVLDLDTAHELPLTQEGPATFARLEVPIANDKQSAHLRITGVLDDPGYTLDRGGLVFDRLLRGLRNTVLLPAGWDVASVSQSATLGMYEGRQFVALINLNAENKYAVQIRARKH